MRNHSLTQPSLARTLVLLLALLFALSACRALPPGFLAPSAAPDSTPGPSPTLITKTMCESGADLRTDIDFLRSLELREDGLISVLVAVDSALGEARTLGTLVTEEYRPQAVDLVLSLENLRLTVDELSQQETLGAGIATLGESIAEIGDAMDALTLELRDPCPDEE